MCEPVAHSGPPCLCHPISVDCAHPSPVHHPFYAECAHPWAIPGVGASNLPSNLYSRVGISAQKDEVGITVNPVLEIDTGGERRFLTPSPGPPDSSLSAPF